MSTAQMVTGAFISCQPISAQNSHVIRQKYPCHFIGDFQQKEQLMAIFVNVDTCPKASLPLLLPSKYSSRFVHLLTDFNLNNKQLCVQKEYIYIRCLT